ncbi:MAG: helix-turn-helix domain-containing protein [Hyphomonadaceae bacterium]
MSFGGNAPIAFRCARHAAAILEAAGAGEARAVEAAANDLVAGSTTAELPTRDAPSWLGQLRDELEETSLADIDVGARARAAGAHPAHASRLFRRCFGASITEHAQAHSVRRAIGPLFDRSLPLSQVALSAGFCDQSHMNRVFRRVLGRTPGAQRALMAAAG